MEIPKIYGPYSGDRVNAWVDGRWMNVWNVDEWMESKWIDNNEWIN